jgi:hypothetical protein
VHRLGPPAVRVEWQRALAELPVAIEFRITIDDGVELDLASFCRSQYRAQQHDDIWRIARISSIYERDTLTLVMPGTQIDIDPDELIGYRPSYRFLAWYQNRLGIDLRSDLLGDDQPEPVVRQYQAEADWLEETPARTGTTSNRKEQHQ